MTESDGVTNFMYPNEARLRNLTYSAPLYVDMRKEVQVADPNDPRNQGVTNTADMHWEIEEEDEDWSKVFFGKVPIMLRSAFCVLSELNMQELTDVGECPYDQVTFFGFDFKRVVTLLSMALKRSLLLKNDYQLTMFMSFQKHPHLLIHILLKFDHKLKEALKWPVHCQLK
jgi:DNA-directed RNA polymerase beta subunit